LREEHRRRTEGRHEPGEQRGNEGLNNRMVLLKKAEQRFSDWIFHSVGSWCLSDHDLCLASPMV
jgi:hypothetical protein